VRERADRRMVNTRPAMKLPSITVVTPCLNAERTIRATLDSVHGQGYPLLEHVVVDGGSTDRTVEIAREYPGVTVISEPDRGRPDAANKGIALATGDVVGFLNADDAYEPRALSRVGHAFAVLPEVAWVTGYCRIVDGAGEEIRHGVTRYKNWLLRRWSYGLYLTQNFVADPATFVRREALEQVGGFDERYPTAHDYDLWLRVGRLSEPAVIEETLATFQMVEGTLSMEGFEGQFREHEQIARSHGEGHRTAVAVNALTSRAIVLAYRAMRRRATA
jgi:glycosyltransferase involved in cell wall biosynthesis